MTLVMRCNICYLPIHDQSGKENCPRCFNEFHRDHLAAWLLKNDYCPMCRDPLSESFREQLRPKTEKERVRLENVLSTLDGIGDLFRELETKEKKRIMQSRSQEFGLEGNSIGDLLKLFFPLLLIGGALFVVFLALTT